MKTHLLIVFLLSLSLIGCGGGGSSSSSQSTESELKYFGFAFVDCGWDDPNDDVVKTNYLDEVSSFTNANQMCVFSPDEFIGHRVDQFYRADVQVMLYVEGILFDRTADPSSHSGNRLSLRPDARELWNTFVTLNRESLVPEKILALYVVDEPVWSGLSEPEFVQALEIIKETLPNISTFSVEAYPVVNQIMVPELLDWVGFDQYNTSDPYQDPVWMNNLNTVHNARTRPDQKLVIVASTQWMPQYQVTPDAMETVVYSYYDIAVSYPDVIALAGYTWPGGLNSPNQLGARSLPENVQQAYRNIGKEITRK